MSKKIHYLLVFIFIAVPMVYAMNEKNSHDLKKTGFENILSATEVPDDKASTVFPLGFDKCFVEKKIDARFDCAMLEREYIVYGMISATIGSVIVANPCGMSSALQAKLLLAQDLFDRYETNRLLLSRKEAYEILEKLVAITRDFTSTDSYYKVANTFLYELFSAKPRSSNE